MTAKPTPFDFLDTLKQQQPPKPKIKDRWTTAPLRWLKPLSRVALGRIGVQLYVAHFGGQIMDRKATFDIHHGKKKIEAKLALRSSQSNGQQFRYQWYTIRANDEWTHLWLVAVSFNSVRCFLVPRSEAELKKAKESLQCYWVGNDKDHDHCELPGWLKRREVL